MLLERGIISVYLPSQRSCVCSLVFTKLLKPVYSTLRQVGYMNVGYIDDSYLQGTSSDECSNNVQDTVHLLTRVGFLLNKKKSILVPSHELTFLGFIMNSLNMTMRPTPEKSRKALTEMFSIIFKNSGLYLRSLRSDRLNAFYVPWS